MGTQRHSIFSPYHVYFIIRGASTVVVFYPILNNQLFDFWDDQWVMMSQYTGGDSYKSVFSGYLLYFGIYTYQRMYTWYNTYMLKQELRSFRNKRLIIKYLS